METKLTRYKQGSIERRENAKGPVWRYRYTDAGGRPKVLTFSSKQYPTQGDVMKATERLRHEINQGTAFSHIEKLTVPVAVDIYLDSLKSGIKPRTVSTYRNHGRHISDAYRGVTVDSLNGLQIQTWISSLSVSGSQKANIRMLFRGVVRYAMLSGKTNLPLNPLEFIKLKGVTKRTKKIIIITPEQFVRLVKATRKPYDRTVMLCGFLGLRVGECLALQWDDFDAKVRAVEIQRSISSGHLTDAKTEASHAALPVPDALMVHIQAWKEEAVKAAGEKDQNVNPWLFPAPRSASGLHGHSGIIVQKVLHPACDKAGIPRIGFHALRHSYRSWLDSRGISAATSKDMMRHADISTTMNVYGRTLPAGMRDAADSIAALLG